MICTDWFLFCYLHVGTLGRSIDSIGRVVMKSEDSHVGMTDGNLVETMLSQSQDNSQHPCRSGVKCAVQHCNPLVCSSDRTCWFADLDDRINAKKCRLPQLHTRDNSMPETS